MRAVFAVTVAWLALGALAAGCSSEGERPQAAPAPPAATAEASRPPLAPPSSDLATATIRVVGAQGQEHALRVEVPQTREAMLRGLMGRTALDDDTGMLFLFGSLRSGFWMKDTLIPLSVAFIAQDGTIVDIQDMAPQSLDIHNTNKPYYYGLEVNRGWFARKGVKAGDRVRFPWPYESAPKSPWEQ